MNKETFVISDTHFGHANIIKFLDKNNNNIRPFSDVEEMDSYMIEKWNSVVKDGDRVYHLGDVVINRRCLPILDKLNGKKVLIKGNHDIFRLRDYVKYFDDIRAYKVIPEYGIIMSHIPIHPESLKRWKLNIHGHLHNNKLDDPKYKNVSVECINYTPLNLKELTNEVKDV
jgi:calcineurin-like phosphoesterase family protein